MTWAVAGPAPPRAVVVSASVPLQYTEPATLAEASALLRSGADAKALAGGTALVLMLRQKLIAPDLLVGLRRVPGLDGITTDGERIRIGAGVSLQQVADSDQVRRHAPALAHACGEVGNVRVRNRATIGGNLAEADYASDPPAVLISLGAFVCVAGGEADRRIPAADFVTDFYTTQLAQGELVVAVEVPVVVGRRCAYHKFRTRSSEDRPCVGVAASLTCDGEGRVAALEVVVGAVAAIPQRDPMLTGRAVGTTLGRETIAAIAAATANRIRPIGDGRGSSWYRTQVIEVMVRRVLAEVA